MVGVDDSNLSADTHEVGRLDLRIGSRLMLLYNHQMNQLNSRSDFIMITAP